jgi:hypothetical protein
MKLKVFESKAQQFMDYRNRHTNLPLTNLALAYRPEGFIADQVSPVVPVMNIKDKFVYFGTENLKKHSTIRDPKDTSNIMTWSMSATDYHCKPHSLAAVINDLDRQAIPKGENLENEAVISCMDPMMIEWEADVATLMTTYGNYASSSLYTTLTGGDQWSDDQSDIKGMIKTAKEAVKNACGKMPNSIVLPWDVALALEDHPAIIDLRKYNTPNLLEDLAIPKSIFGLKVFIAGSQYDTYYEGQSGLSLSNIWGDYVVVFYLNPQVGWQIPMFCKTFRYGQLGFFVKKWDLDKNAYLYNPTQIEVVDEGRAPTMVGNAFGYLFIDTLA